MCIRDSISAYLNAAERRNALPMFYLELVSGLRKGELVALQWSDLDEANCTISVSKPVSYTHLDVYKRQHRKCGLRHSWTP